MTERKTKKVVTVLQGSEESQLCLSLWLSLHLNFPHKLKTKLLGKYYINGNAISHFLFSLSSCIQFLYIFFSVSACTCVCVCCYTSGVVFTPRGCVDSCLPSCSCRLCWQSLTARPLAFIPNHTTINSLKQHLLLSVLSLKPKHVEAHQQGNCGIRQVQAINADQHIKKHSSFEIP